MESHAEVDLGYLGRVVVVVVLLVVVLVVATAVGATVVGATVVEAVTLGAGVGTGATVDDGAGVLGVNNLTIVVGGNVVDVVVGPTGTVVGVVSPGVVGFGTGGAFDLIGVGVLSGPNT
jgi:hypothetical protein